MLYIATVLIYGVECTKQNWGSLSLDWVHCRPIVIKLAAASKGMLATLACLADTLVLSTYI